jgi:hypothetical protein
MEENPEILNKASIAADLIVECLKINKCSSRTSILALGNLLLQIYKGLGATPKEVKVSLDGMLVLYKNLIDKSIEK